MKTGSKLRGGWGWGGGLDILSWESAPILSIKMTISQNPKIWKLVFQSLQHIPHLSCKFDHFWKKKTFVNEFIYPFAWIESKTKFQIFQIIIFRVMVIFVTSSPQFSIFPILFSTFRIFYKVSITSEGGVYISLVGKSQNHPNFRWIFTHSYFILFSTYRIFHKNLTTP